jgi:hypothetical protein
LAADQPGFDRDADDIGVSGEPDRGEDTDVPESRDNYAFAAHVAGASIEVSRNSVEPLEFSAMRGIRDGDGAIIATS